MKYIDLLGAMLVVCALRCSPGFASERNNVELMNSANSASADRSVKHPETPSVPLLNTHKPVMIRTTLVDSTKRQTGAIAIPTVGEHINWQVIGSGGGRSASTNYISYCTVGQSAIGLSTSTSFRLNSGFWQPFVSGCCVNKTGNIDCDPSDGCDISDLSALIDYLYISFTPLCCPAEANTDGQPGIDISDLSALIDYLYISFTPPAACQ